jgi:hypothetical protein
MGNFFSKEYPTQQTYKICLKCNNNKIYNNYNIDVLNHFDNFDEDLEKKEPVERLLLCCDKGHLFYYCGTSEHIEYVLKYFKKKKEIDEEKEQDKLKIKENDELIDEINELKKNIEFLTKYYVNKK